MLASLDVYYHDTTATAAAVLFHDWADAIAAKEMVVRVPDVEPYEPGQFYRRELPCLLAILRTIPPVKTIIIDGYVWLDGPAKPGLGAHLYEALDEQVAVIGVAKTKFQGATEAREVTRGTSARPLFVTAVGIPLELAANAIQSMHGKHRIPTLLARADQLSRQAMG